MHIEKLFLSLALSTLPQVSTFMLELIFIIIIMFSSSGEVLQIATQVAQTPNVVSSC